MSKPLGYWGLDHNNSLVKDISETWGDCLEKMNQADTLWLIGRIASEAWQELDIDYPPTDDADAVVSRLHELSLNQKIALIQALANS